MTLQHSVQVVSGIIENHRGQVLLAERPVGKHLAGLWEFPGGKIERGESPRQALKRELQEELELDVRIVKDLGVFSFPYAAGAIELHVFSAVPLSEPKATADVQNFRWEDPRTINLELLAPADHEPLKAYLLSYSPPSVQ